MKTIVHKFTTGALAGKTMTGGVPDTHPTAGRGVRFPWQPSLLGIAKNGDDCFARLSTNPGLQEAVEVYEAARRAEEESRLAAEKAANDRIESGADPIQLRYVDGEYLSGYMVDGYGAELLVRLELAKEVRGWGVHVDNRVIEAVGDSFTYPAAVELARPAIEAKEAAKKARADSEAAVFAEAVSTGKATVLRTWVTSQCCNGNDDDCSFDSATEYAMPDGSRKTEYVCCH